LPDNRNGSRTFWGDRACEKIVLGRYGEYVVERPLGRLHDEPVPLVGAPCCGSGGSLACYRAGRARWFKSEPLESAFAENASVFHPNAGMCPEESSVKNDSYQEIEHCPIFKMSFVEMIPHGISIFYILETCEMRQTDNLW